MNWQPGFVLEKVVEQCDRWCVRVTLGDGPSLHKHFENKEPAERYLRRKSFQRKVTVNDWYRVDEKVIGIRLACRSHVTFIDADRYESEFRNRTVRGGPLNGVYCDGVLVHQMGRGPVQMVHRDGNRLNNVRSNLITQSEWKRLQEAQRAKRTALASSLRNKSGGVKGVHLYRERSCWVFRYGTKCKYFRFDPRNDGDSERARQEAIEAAALVY
jgi:hypothetical protein